MAGAYRKQEQGKEVAAVSALRALVDGNDTDGWMAQGLEIDYFICAKTEESVKRNFVEGLSDTIDINLRKRGTVKSLLEPAPIEVWKEYYQSVGEKKIVSVVHVEIDVPVPVPTRPDSSPSSGEAASGGVVFDQVAFLTVA